MSTPEATSDYQTRLDAERKATREAYDALYKGVAEYLQFWAWDRNPDPEDPHSNYKHERYRLVSQTVPGARLTLGIIQHGADRGKVHVSGYWPQHPGNGPITTPRDVNEQSPSINCSLTRGYQAIANDIERRFLPEYLRIFAKCQGRINQSIAYENKKAANWQLVCTMKCVVPHTHRQDTMAGDIRSGSLDNGYGSVHMSSADTVQIELRSVPIDRALAILEAIGKL